jgi:hypothetical protein
MMMMIAAGLQGTIIITRSKSVGKNISSRIIEPS